MTNKKRIYKDLVIKLIMTAVKRYNDIRISKQSLFILK